MSTPGTTVTRNVWIVFIGLMIGNALSSLDTTVVATALPTIVGDLHGLRDLSWLATSYLLTAMVSTPLYGKLGDLYGRKRIFLVALVVFLVGSILCGAAQSMNHEQQVENTSGATALVFEDQRLRYEELNARANQLRTSWSNAVLGQV